MTPITHHSSRITAFIALGGNLDDPAAQVRHGIDELAALPHTRLQRASALYRSTPVGYRDQPDFINAVAQVATQLVPRELLEALLAIEHRHGRVRGVPNGPRTLDLDLLLYGDLVAQQGTVRVPRDDIDRYPFVLRPLADIAGEMRHPVTGRTFRQMWTEHRNRGELTRVELDWDGQPQNLRREA